MSALSDVAHHDPAAAGEPGADSIGLIVPDNGQRQTLARMLAGLNVPVHEYSTYPDAATLDEVGLTACGIFIVDLNTNTERSLSLIETICSHHASPTVMAWSANADPGLLMRAMRAGAREFLTPPVVPGALADAVSRALGRRKKIKRPKATGKLLVFAGSKGGAGATTLATNFAIALSDEGAGKVAVVDLDVHLGEVALALGLTPKLSILDALQNVERLDAVFLSSLLTKHTSGISVLAAPEEYVSFTDRSHGIDRLLRILREEFAFVVVDAGRSWASVEDALFNLADGIYLITETSIPALRNARRLLSFIAGRERACHIEVVLNRFNSREVDIDENSVAKALARPVDWRIPNDFTAVRSAENAGIPLAMKNSAITRVLHQMARAACGKAEVREKKGRSLLALFQ